MEYAFQLIEARDSCISHLTKEVETLSCSLHERESTAKQFQKLSQQVTSTPDQLSKILTLTTQIAELRQKLQEAEYQKQQVVSEREAAVQDMEAKRKVEVQLHKHLGKLWFTDMYSHTTYIIYYFVLFHR